MVCFVKRLSFAYSACRIGVEEFSFVDGARATPITRVIMFSPFAGASRSVKASLNVNLFRPFSLTGGSRYRKAPRKGVRRVRRFWSCATVKVIAPAAGHRRPWIEAEDASGCHKSSALAAKRADFGLRGLARKGPFNFRRAIGFCICYAAPTRLYRGDSWDYRPRRTFPRVSLTTA